MEWRGGNAPAGLTDLLTEQLLVRLSQSGRFSHITSPKDLEAALGLEQQRQLLDCDNTSCLSDIAASLGVTYIVMGTAGRLGDTYVLSLRMLLASAGTVVSSASRQVKVDSEAALVETVNDMTQEVLAPLGPARPSPRRRAVERRPGQVTGQLDDAEDRTPRPRVPRERRTDDDREDADGDDADDGAALARQRVGALLGRGMTGVVLGAIPTVMVLLLLGHGLFGLGVGALSPAFGGLGAVLVPLALVLAVAGVSVGVVHALASGGAAVATLWTRGRWETLDRALAAAWLLSSGLAVAGGLLTLLGGVVVMALGGTWAYQTTGGRQVETYDAEPGYPVVSLGFSWVLASGWMVAVGVLSLVLAVAATVLGENPLGW
jgi:hypothetical protein